MKKILATLLLGTAVTVAALPVSAQTADSMVTLTASGSTAAVHLNLPEEQSQGVTALQMSFEVVSSDPIQMEFVFDDSLASSVQEYTYNEQTGVINVYLAGRSELLDGGSADLGEIRMEGSEGSEASVRFVPDSLKLVDSSFGKTEPAVASNGEVSLSVAGTTAPTPAPTSKPEPTSAPSETPSEGGASDDAKESAAQSTATSGNAPASKPAGSGQQSAGNSGSKKPSSASTATPSPTASPVPEKEPQATPAPSAAPQEPAETAQPEQSLTEQDSGFRLPVIPVVVAVCVVVAAIIGVVIVRFRR